MRDHPIRALSVTSRLFFYVASLLFFAHPVHATENRPSSLLGDYHYTPSIREAYVGANTPLPLANLDNPKITKKRLPIQSTSPSTETVSPEVPQAQILELPKMSIVGRRVPKPFHLPRLNLLTGDEVYTPIGDVFTTPQAKQRLLVKKYLTEFDQALNKFTIPLVGVSLEARANNQARIDDANAQLNHIANLIELSALLGRSTKEEDKRLIKEYYRLYYSRARLGSSANKP